MASVKPIRSNSKRLVAPKRRSLVESPLDRAKPHEVVWAEVSGIFEATRTLGDCCYVYLTGEENGPLKIGVAKDPIKRLRTMQTGNPRRLRVERVLIGDQSVEALLHELWEPFAIRAPGKNFGAPGTEWFEPEVRAELLPIATTAATRQVELLAVARQSEDQDVSVEMMERAVREAHVVHDHTAQGRDVVRRLAVGGGYQIPRPSRI